MEWRPYQYITITQLGREVEMQSNPAPNCKDGLQGDTIFSVPRHYRQREGVGRILPLIYKR